MEGLDNAQIAARLGISERTARAHVSSVLERLGAANRTQAAVAAIQRGWLATLLRSLIALLRSRAGDAPLRGGRRPAGAARRAVARRCAPPEARRALGRTTAAPARTRVQVERRARGACRPRCRSSSPPRPRSTGSARRPASRRPCSPTATVAEGVLDGDLYLQGVGRPVASARAALRRLADRVGDDRRRARSTGRVYGDESFFDRRRGGPQRLRRSRPTSGPLSALAFNHGSLLPLRRAACRRDPPRSSPSACACSLRRERGRRRRGGARRRTRRRTRRRSRPSQSPPLAALVRHTNHVSDNYYAETLLKGLGARLGQRGLDRGGRARRARVRARARASSARVVDGSGLSRANSISPRAVGRLLLDARRTSRGSTPSTARCRSPGQSGTLRQADARHAPRRAAAARRPAR